MAANAVNMNATDRPVIEPAQEPSHSATSDSIIKKLYAGVIKSWNATHPFHRTVAVIKGFGATIGTILYSFMFPALWLWNKFCLKETTVVEFLVLFIPTTLLWTICMGIPELFFLQSGLNCEQIKSLYTRAFS